jgi:hypothetical protein
MAKRTMFLGLVLVLAVMAAGADEGSVAGTAYEAFPSSLGFYTNTSGGVGLSWQHWYGNFGLAVAAGGMYNEEGSYPVVATGYDMVILDYSVQVRFSWMLFAEEFSPWLSNNLHAVAYLSHRGITGIEDVWSETEFPEILYSVTKPYQPYFMAGVGVAAEATLFGHFSQTLDFMYVAKWPLSLDVAVGYSVRYRY